MSTLRPASEWHEDHGSVLWWRFPIEEPPYVGSMLDMGFAVGAKLLNQFGEEIGQMQGDVGGFPFSEDDPDLFWEPLVIPERPKA